MGRGEHDGGKKLGVCDARIETQMSDSRKEKIFTKIIDDQKMDSRVRAGGRISFLGALLRVGFLAPRDTERVFDACLGVGLSLKLKLKLKMKLK